MPKKSAMTNAAAPISGMICPPVDAVASTPPANEGEKATIFNHGNGDNTRPTTFDTAEPEMVPNRELAIIAAWAGHL